MRGAALVRPVGETTVLALLACLVLVAPALAADASVDVGGFRYTPNVVTIDQGDTVTWNWVGPELNHDVYEGVPPADLAAPIPPALFESHPDIAEPGLITAPPPGGTFSHAFAAAGTYNYWCRRHPRMTASVVVNAGPPPVTPSAPVAALAPARTICVSKRNFPIRIRQPRRSARITAVKVTVNGKPVTASRARGRFTARVDLRGFAGGVYEVQIIATAADGKTLRGTRRYRTCAPKLSSSGLPPL